MQMLFGGEKTDLKHEYTYAEQLFPLMHSP
jgi:hypothetical protein